MRNFNYKNGTEIIFGKDTENNVGAEVKNMPIKYYFTLVVEV